MILKFFLIITLLHQLFVYTKTYLSYGTVIRIDIKDNNIDENYPIITLNINLNKPDWIILSHFENFTNRLFFDEGDGYFYYTVCHPDDSTVRPSYTYSDVLTRCKNYSANDFLDRKIINRFQENTGIYFRTSEKTFNFSNILSPTLGWIVRLETQIIDYENIRATITMKMDYPRLPIILNNTFLEIYSNRNKSHETIGNILLHSQPIPHLMEMTSVDTQITADNYSLVITKTLRSYLKPPFGNCSDYSTETGRPFNGSSHMLCYRQCFRSHVKEFLGCVPLFTDDSLNELDYIPIDEKLCSYEKLKFLLKNVSEYHVISKCMTICPKDCLTVDYNYYQRKSDSLIGNEFWHNLDKTQRLSKQSLIWDSTQPMFIYKEESVMTFTDYLCYCGGLMGLWFGTNAKDLIFLIIESMFWLKLWHKLQGIAHSLCLKLNKYKI